MRNLIFIAAFTFAAFFQLSATNEPLSTTLKVIENEKVVILNFKELDVETFVIYDANSTIVFSQSVEKHNNGINYDGVKYDMTKLPAGRYTLKIICADYIELHNTIITAESVTIESHEVHFRPSVNEIDSKITVEAILANKEDIMVSIYDRAGDLVYDFNDQKTGNYKKVFNLTQLAKGHYIVVVSTNYFSETSNISL